MTRREEWLRLVAAAMAGGARSPDDAMERADLMQHEADRRFADEHNEMHWPGPVQTKADVAKDIIAALKATPEQMAARREFAAEVLKHNDAPSEAWIDAVEAEIDRTNGEGGEHG